MTKDEAQDLKTNLDIAWKQVRELSKKLDKAGYEVVLKTPIKPFFFNSR